MLACWNGRVSARGDAHAWGWLTSAQWLLWQRSAAKQQRRAGVLRCAVRAAIELWPGFQARRCRPFSAHPTNYGDAMLQGRRSLDPRRIDVFWRCVSKLTGLQQFLRPCHEPPSAQPCPSLAGVWMAALDPPSHPSQYILLSKAGRRSHGANPSPLSAPTPVIRSPATCGANDRPADTLGCLGCTDPREPASTALRCGSSGGTLAPSSPRQTSSTSSSIRTLFPG